MKMYMISNDIDSRLGMRLAGVDGVTAHSRDELVYELENISPDVGIVVVNKNLAGKFPDIIKVFQLRLIMVTL